MPRTPPVARSSASSTSNCRVRPEGRLRPAQDHAQRLERFLAPNQLDPLLFSGRSLYLLPDGPAAEMGYQVL